MFFRALLNFKIVGFYMVWEPSQDVYLYTMVDIFTLNLMSWFASKEGSIQSALCVACLWQKGIRMQPDKWLAAYGYQTSISRQNYAQMVVVTVSRTGQSGHTTEQGPSYAELAIVLLVFDKNGMRVRINDCVLAFGCKWSDKWLAAMARL